MKFNHVLGQAIALVFGTSSVLAQVDLPQVPTSVAHIYVFLQKRDSTGRGSGSEIASMITPKEFQKNFERYRKLARTKKVRLIITAESRDGQWIQDQISYKGIKLQRAAYRNPGIDRTVPGAEVPLD